MPKSVDEQLRLAIAEFWGSRAAGALKGTKTGAAQGGTRGEVLSGLHMAAIERLVVDLLKETGLKPDEVRTRTELEIPGYYRSQKRWDLLVIADRKLVAAIEFKSQVGSFGNNSNNRSEEAIGNAEDLWTAFREGRFGTSLQPFVGYFFLLQDDPEVHTRIKNIEPHFKVDPVFVEDGKGVSRAKRYEILLDRLVKERKYTAACLVLSPRPSKPGSASVSFPSEDLSFKRFAAALQGHAITFRKGQ